MMRGTNEFGQHFWTNARLVEIDELIVQAQALLARLFLLKRGREQRWMPPPMSPISSFFIACTSTVDAEHAVARALAARATACSS